MRGDHRVLKTPTTRSYILATPTSTFTPTPVTIDISSPTGRRNILHPIIVLSLLQPLSGICPPLLIPLRSTLTLTLTLTRRLLLTITKQRSHTLSHRFLDEEGLRLRLRVGGVRGHDGIGLMGLLVRWSGCSPGGKWVFSAELVALMAMKR